MTVNKLSKKNIEKAPGEEGELIEQFISGGGKTIEESKSNEEDFEHLSRFTLRMPKPVERMIDDHRKKKVGNVSRNTWILEAIAWRLKQND